MGKVRGIRWPLVVVNSVIAGVITGSTAYIAAVSSGVEPSGAALVVVFLGGVVAMAKDMQAALMRGKSDE